MGLFTLLKKWLKWYSSRMVGDNLYDVRKVTDHFLPDQGEVDFKMVANYLPENAYRVLEIIPKSTYEQV